VSISGFKGFNKDLQCRGFQYEIGKEYETDQSPVRCTENGFHFCEYPLDVFNHYPPAGGRFCEVEGEGQADKRGGDTKIAVSKISIGLEIGIKGLVDAAIKFVFDKADWSKKENHVTGTRGAASATGTRGAASATGYQGAASATGTRGAASATGYQGAASATGKEGVAMATGYEGKAKGALGAWIVLAEWAKDDEGEWHRIDVQSARVDGEKIKADTFYRLVGGKFVEDEEQC